MNSSSSSCSSGVRPAVLSIGRIYCDLIFTGLKTLPELGKETFAQDLNIAAGGGAFITAAHLAHKKRACALLARLGLDPLSVSIMPELIATGADLRFLERCSTAGPQVTVASVVDNDRAFLSRRAGTAQPATLEEALNWSEAGHLHIAEYATLHEIPDLIMRAKAKGLTVSLDPSWDETLIYDPALLNACKGADIFLPNQEEALAITGHNDPVTALDVLGAHFPCVVLKGGANGAWLKARDLQLHQSAKAVTVVDTTGAGDAFNAGFIDKWMQGAGFEAALNEGIVCGGLAVQAAGGAAILATKP